MNKLSLIAAAGLVAVAVSSAHAAYNFNGSTISENFDGLPTTTTANVFSSTIGVQSTISGTGFDGAKIAGTGAAATGLVADAGTNASGSIYSYGAAAVAERALGAVASGSNTMAFGFQLNNNTTDIIDSVTVSFTQENWRSSTSVVNTIVASFSTTASASSYLSDAAGFTLAPALDLVGPAPVTTNGALDGNDVANQVARTLTVTGLSIAPGSSIFFRFQDFNDAGNDAGLAIDGLSISATLIPEPTTLGLIAAGSLVMLRRRK